MVTFVNPTIGMPFPKESTVPVTISVTSNYSLKKIDYYLNDNFIGSSTSTSFSFVPDDVNAIVGNNTLRAVVTDEVYNKGESSVVINIQ